MYPSFSEVEIPWHPYSRMIPKITKNRIRGVVAYKVSGPASWI